MDDKPSPNLPSESLAQNGSNPLAFSSCLQSAPWFIDSSDSDHMTNQSQLFTTYFPCAGNLKVRIEDSSLSPIAGKGLVVLPKNIELKFVLQFSQIIMQSFVN